MKYDFGQWILATGMAVAVVTGIGTVVLLLDTIHLLFGWDGLVWTGILALAVAGLAAIFVRVVP